MFARPLQGATTAAGRRNVTFINSGVIPDTIENMIVPVTSPPVRDLNNPVMAHVGEMGQSECSCMIAV